MSATTRQRLERALEGARFVESRDGMPTLEVEREQLIATLRKLRDEAGFTSLTFVTAIDRYPKEPRLTVHHQLLSIEHCDRVRLQTELPGEDERLPSCRELFPGASFMERECFDMFGIQFDGHGDLRRLLMPPGYLHHPLRKDFPHHGIEPDRLYREWDRDRRQASECAP